MLSHVIVLSLQITLSFALSLFYPEIYWTTRCGDYDVASMFASGGPIQSSQTCPVELIGNPTQYRWDDKACMETPQWQSLFYQRLSCHSEGRYLSCPWNSNPVTYAMFNVLDSTCTNYNAVADNIYVGSYGLKELNCMPATMQLGWGMKKQIWIQATCSNNYGILQAYTNASCRFPIAGAAPVMLNGNCNPIPWLGEQVYVQGTCTSCEAVDKPFTYTAIPTNIPTHSSTWTQVITSSILPTRTQTPIPTWYTPSVTTLAPKPTNAPPPYDGISGGGIAGIVLASLFVLAAIGMLLYILTRRREKKTSQVDNTETLVETKQPEPILVVPPRRKSQTLNPPTQLPAYSTVDPHYAASNVPPRHK